MKHATSFLLKLCVLILGIVLVSTRATDADLLDEERIPSNQFEATTLDFSHRRTVNEAAHSSLFSVDGILPSGFQVESVRVKKEGELFFSYAVAVETVSNSPLCEKLNLRALKNWKEIYYGDLLSFSHTGSVVNAPYEDLVFVLELDNNSPQIKNLECHFSLVFSTIKDKGFFSDEEKLESRVRSGNWQ